MAKFLRGSSWLLMGWIFYEAARALEMEFWFWVALTLYFVSWCVNAYNEANPPRTREQVIADIDKMIKDDSLHGHVDSRLTDWKGSPM